MSYRKNFLETQKRVRINHGKRAIGIRVIEVLLFKERWNVHILTVKIIILRLLVNKTAKQSSRKYTSMALCRVNVTPAFLHFY